MTYSIEENHHSGLELYFMPRFFVYNPCCAEPHTHEFYQIFGVLNVNSFIPL